MASTLRSAASGRTGISGGARSGGPNSGAARKAAAAAAAAAAATPAKPVRVLPKIIENNQDVTPKRLIDPEQFYSKVKDSFLTQDASSTVSLRLLLYRRILIYKSNCLFRSQVKLPIQLLSKYFLRQSKKKFLITLICHYFHTFHRSHDRS